MKRNKSISAILPFFVMGLLLIFNACEETEEFGEDYDINWPAPVITSLSEQTAMIDEIITITGTGLDKTTTVTLDGEACEIVEGSITPTELKFKVARRARSGKVEIRNTYRRKAETENKLVVEYPEVIVTKWPATLIVGKPFTLEGVNVDLITEVKVKDSTILIKQPSSTDKITVATSTANLIAGETVSISVKALGPIDESEVSGISVLAEEPEWVPAAPIVLWTFEDGDPVVTNAGVAPTAEGRDLGGLTHARGEHYYSVTKAGTGGWTNFIYIEKNGPFDLSAFHEPHLTFLVNTNGKRGYINPFFTQDGSEKDNHLTNGNANDRLKYGDDYAVQTIGWEWRSYPLSKLFKDFDVLGSFEKVRMRFTSGNVGNGGAPEDFEIHVDQIMITDGLQWPRTRIYDFEDGNYTWDNSQSPTHGINLASIPDGAGAKYLTVQKAGVSSWNWLGAVVNSNDVDLSTYDDPYISFMLNTGSEKGYVQIEVWENNTKWGGDSDKQNYLFQTNGEWVPVTLKLSAILGNWGGDASEFNPAGVLDYVKIGFTTGNVASGNYEISIDDIYISDGGMW